MRRVVQEEVREAKLIVRPGMDVDAWGSGRLFQEDLERAAEAALASGILGTMGTLDARDTPASTFDAGWDAEREPALVMGGCESWPAFRDGGWSPAMLAARFEGSSFECGESPAGEGTALMSIESFVEYSDHQADDDPLYLFDGTFESSAPELEREYGAPSVFAHDLLALLTEGSDDPDARPPWRWLLVGPTRSGSFPHRDPLATSAWNASLHGRKWWVLLGPDTPEEFVLTGRVPDAPSEAAEAAAASASAARPAVPPAKAADDALAPDGCRSAVRWFLRVLPRIREAIRTATPDSPSWLRNARTRELVQEPGAVVFVPSGWFHAVLNISPGASVAVTQNFASPSNLDEVRAALAEEDEGMAAELDQRLAARGLVSLPPSGAPA